MNVLSMALHRLRRKPARTALVVLLVGTTLASAGLVGTALAAVSGLAEDARRATNLTAYVNPNVPPDRWTSLRDEANALPGVHKVRLIRPDALLDEIRELLKDAPDLVEGLTPELLPALIEVEPAGDSTLLMARLAELEDVNEVRGAELGQGPSGRLHALLAVGTTTGWSLLFLLALATSSLIAGVAGLQALAGRDETELLRLFGATELMIRLPLLVEGALLGTLGSLVAAAAVVGTVAAARAAIGGPIPGLLGVPLTLPAGWTWGLFLAAGPVLGAFGAGLASQPEQGRRERW